MILLPFLSIKFPFFKISISLPSAWGNPVVIWTVALLGYCFVASVLPVWVLLQPRDYINSHQLVLALGLLMLGVLVAGMTGQADIVGSAPAIAEASPVGALLRRT